MLHVKQGLCARVPFIWHSIVCARNWRAIESDTQLKCIGAMHAADNTMRKWCLFFRN